jgi:hypothetical protein
MSKYILIAKSIGKSFEQSFDDLKAANWALSELKSSNDWDNFELYEVPNSYPIDLLNELEVVKIEMDNYPTFH